MKKRFITLGLASALCLASSIVSMADKENTNPYLEILTNGHEENGFCNMKEDGSGDGWSFDADSQTLILDGIDAQNIQLFNSEEPITIELVGDDNQLSMGIFFKTKGDVTICGDGTLNIGGNWLGTLNIGDEVTIESGTIISKNRIWLNGGKLHIDGGTVSIDVSENSSYALMGTTYEYDDALTITDGVLTLHGEKEALSLNHNADPYDSYGIHEGVAFTGEDGEELYLKVEQHIMVDYEYYTSTISDEDGNPVTYAELTASDSTTEPIIIWDPSVGEQEKPKPEEPVTKPEEPVTKPEDPPVATDSDADEKPIATDPNPEEKPDDDTPPPGGSSPGSSPPGSRSVRASTTASKPVNPVYSAATAVGGTWKWDENGWWFAGNDGSYPKNEWAELTWNGQTGWYYFNADGYMQTGWLKIGDNWYFFHDISDGMQGLMYTGWHEIDGKWYYFNPDPKSPVPMGGMFTDCMTPDGYYVDKDGVWIS